MSKNMRHGRQISIDPKIRTSMIEHITRAYGERVDATYGHVDVMADQVFLRETPQSTVCMLAVRRIIRDIANSN